eukprot:252413_1
MNRKKQKKGNKKRQHNKSKGTKGVKKKQNTKGNKKQNNQNKRNKNHQTQQLKSKGLFGLNSSAPSATKYTELIICGFIRNNTTNDWHKDITKLCFNFASNILSILSMTQCQLLIDKFINKKILTKKSKFNCIYNGKYDGFDSEIFHKKCNNKGATLVVIKSNYHYIFGGFVNVPWKTPKGICEYSQDFNSFLFSFYLSTHKLETYPILFDFSKFAIENTLNNGPIFGYTDIIIGGENCDKENISFCKTSCYKINGNGNKLCGSNDDSISEGYYSFMVDNYEVFAFKKK